MADKQFDVDVKATVEGQEEVDKLGKSLGGLGKQSQETAKGSREASKALREARKETRDTASAIKSASGRLDEYRAVTQKHAFWTKESREAQAKLRKEVDEARAKFAASKRATEQAAAALATYKGRADANAGAIARMSNTLAKSRRELDAQRASLSKLETTTAAYTGGVQGAISGTRQWVSGLGAQTVAIGALGLGVVSLGSSLREAGQQSLASRAATQALRFEIDAAKESTLGLVDTYNLTTAANRAAQTGVATTEQRFAELAGAATKLGLAVGRDANESIQDLIGALSTGSAEVLDNLGITLKTKEAHEAYAEQLGKTAAELTDEEKAQAFATIGAQKAIEAAEALTLNLTDQDLAVARAATSWDNLSAKTQEWAAVAAAAAITAIDDLGSAIGQAIHDVTALDAGMATMTQNARLMAHVAARDGAARAQQLAGINAQLEAMGKGLADLGKIDMSDLDKVQKRVDELKDTVYQDQPALGPSLEEYKAAQELEKQRKEAGRAAKKAAQERDRRAKEGERLAKVGQSRVFAMDEDPAGLQDSLNERYAMLAAEVEREKALIDVQLQGVEEGSQEYLALIDRQAGAEQQLLDLQREQTADRLELFQIETEAQRVEAERRLAYEQAAAARRKQIAEEEAKVQEDKAKRWDKAGQEISASIAQVAMAQRQGSETVGQAVAREVAEVARGFQKRLIIYATEQGVKAIMAAASYNYAGAALHTAAAAAAAVGAVTIGRIAGSLESAAAGPAPEPAPAPAGGGGGTGGQTDAGNQGDGARQLDVPISQDPITSGLKTVPQRAVQVTVVLEGPVFGQDKETVGRWIKDAVAAAEGYGGI